MEPQILDGFTHSLSQLLLPISYRAAALSQMETMRLAASFQFKAYVIPTPENPSPGGRAGNNPIGLIPAYGQVEQQVSMDPGSYIYGWMFAVTTDVGISSYFHIRITDACTETALASDYAIALFFHSPPIPEICLVVSLLPQPRIISDPGLINVEIYNDYKSDLEAQLVLYCASPRPAPNRSPSTTPGSSIPVANAGRSIKRKPNMQNQYSLARAGNSILPPQVRTYMDIGRLSNRPQPNIYDACLAHDKLMWDAIVAGGLDQICCPQGREPYYLKPYIAMPDSGRRFKEVGSVLGGHQSTRRRRHSRSLYILPRPHWLRRRN